MVSAGDGALVPTAGTRWPWELLTGVSKHSHALRERPGWSLMQLTLVICNETLSWQHTTNTFLLNESPTLSLERSVQPDTAALNTLQRPCRGWEAPGKTQQKRRWNNLHVSPKSLGLQRSHGFCAGGLTTSRLLHGVFIARSSLPRWTTCWTWDLHPHTHPIPKDGNTSLVELHAKAPESWALWDHKLGEALLEIHPGPHWAQQFTLRGREAGASQRFSFLLYHLLCISNSSLTSSNLSRTSRYTLTDGSQHQKYPNSQVWVKTHSNAFSPPPNYITITGQ